MAAPKGNKYALGLTTSGQPPIFSSPDELKDKILEYFVYCTDNEDKITITGLALFLGFSTRKSLDDYASKKEYLYIIKRAKLVVENSYETNGQTIDIFALKNMDWKDKHEVDNKSSDGSMTPIDLSLLTDEEKQLFLKISRRQKD